MPGASFLLPLLLLLPHADPRRRNEQVFISVQDLATAHLNALTSPAAAGHRYILSGGRLSYDDIVDLARKAVPEMAHRWVKPEEVPVMRLPALDTQRGEKDLGFKCELMSVEVDELQLTQSLADTSAEDTIAAFAKQLFSLEAEGKRGA